MLSCARAQRAPKDLGEGHTTDFCGQEKCAEVLGKLWKTHEKWREYGESIEQQQWKKEIM